MPTIYLLIIVMPPSKGKKSKTTKGGKNSQQLAKDSSVNRYYQRMLYNNLQLGGMPAKKIVRMMYTDNFILTSSTGFHDAAVWMVNSTVDPDYSNKGTNHQPFGRDEWVTYYNKYCVIGAKTHLKFRWNTGSPSTPVLCGGYPDVDATYSTSVTDKQERYPGSTGILSVDPSSTYEVIIPFSVKKFFRHGSPLNDHQLSPAKGANPTIPAFVNTFVQSVDGSSTSTAVQCNIKIEMLVVLLDPIAVSGS